MIRVWLFYSCMPRPALVLSVLSSLGHHKIVAQTLITATALSNYYLGPLDQRTSI